MSVPLALIAWCVGSVPVALIVGRVIRLADRRTPKIVVRRGTAQRWSL